MALGGGGLVAWVDEAGGATGCVERLVEPAAFGNGCGGGNWDGDPEGDRVKLGVAGPIGCGAASSRRGFDVDAMF